MTARVSPAGPLDSELEPELAPDLGRGLDELVAMLLASAEHTDGADHLPDGHFRAMAALGLNGMAVAVESGGLGLTPPEVRLVLRRLGSGCGATAFAFAQHHGTTAAVAASKNTAMRDRWLGRLTGDTLAGIAYAHVRRPGPPALRAEPASDTDGAWILDGRAPWVTSWGLAEVLGVAAQTADGRLLWSLVPASEGGGLSVAKRFELSVLGATATVALTFDGYRIEPDRVIDVVDFGPWADHDRHLAARPNPLCLGIGDRALALLGDIDADRADRLQPAWGELGRRAERQAQTVDRRQADEAAVAKVRAEAVLGTQHLTAALLAAVGGGAMELGHPAQRLHREAGFYVVQAQNAAGRAALLDEVADRL